MTDDGRTLPVAADAIGLGREVGVPMRLANVAYEELTEAMSRGWGARNGIKTATDQQEAVKSVPLAHPLRS